MDVNLDFGEIIDLMVNGYEVLHKKGEGKSQ